MSEETKPSRLDKLLDYCPAVAGYSELLVLLEEARQAYLRGDVADAGAMSVRFPKLPQDVCKKLLTVYGWKQQRIERLEELQVSSAVRYAELITDKRAEAAKKIIDSYSPVMESIATAIGDALNDGDNRFRMTDVRRLAESASQLGGLVLQAAAADGKVPELPESLRDAVDKSKGKQPWITVNATGPVTLAAGDKKKDLPGHDASAEQETGEEQ